MIVISGVPGSGKTYFARLLSKELNFDYLSITRLVQERKNVLSSGFDERRESLIVNDEALLDELRKFPLDHLVVESISPSLLEGLPVQVVVIVRCPIRELFLRLRRRGYPPQKILENLEAELLDVPLIEALNSFGEDFVVEVDTTSSVDKSLDLVRSVLDGKIRPPIFLPKDKDTEFSEYEEILKSLRE